MLVNYADLFKCSFRIFFPYLLMMKDAGLGVLEISQTGLPEYLNLSLELIVSKWSFSPLLTLSSS